MTSVLATRASGAPLTLHASLLAALLALSGLTLSACGEDPVTDEETDNIEADEEDDSSADDPTPKPDAGKPRIDSGTVNPTPPPKVDGGAKADAGTTPPRADGGTASLDAGTMMPPTAPRDLTPSPDNIKECPPTAPENPVGSCIGVPIYATCSYTSYNCICDWYHWICI